MRNFSTAEAPHIVAQNNVQRIMLLVAVALVPACIAHVVWFGPSLPINMALCSVSALATEAIILFIRRKSLRRYLLDGSALLTGLLLAFAIPPLAPWWLAVSGAAFAILFAKHLYGGLGFNMFNPAMAGYAALLVSFPAYMTRWSLPTGIAKHNLSVGDTFTIIFTGNLPESLTWDWISGASPLASERAGLIMRATMEEIHAQTSFGSFAGVGWEWISIAALIGGAFLIALRIIRWHIPVAVLTSLFIAAALAHIYDPGHFSSPLFHLFSGATMLGAFFIATDPVSAATSDRGRLIYGAGIGVLTFVIRAAGGYPDGIAFAVLTMNATVPLIDRYTIPRIYGHKHTASEKSG